VTRPMAQPWTAASHRHTDVPVTDPGLDQDHKQPAADQAYPGHIDLLSGLKRRTEGARVSAEASELVSIPRAELDAPKAELKRLRREAGRGVAMAAFHSDAGPGDDVPTFTREELAEAWEIRE
jgi:hypothetical protein